MSCVLSRRTVLVAALSAGVPAIAQPRIPSLAQKGRQFVFLEPMPQAPDVALMRLDGKPQSLAGLTRGRTSLIYIGATWCPPCRVELPALQARHERPLSRDPRIVPVMVDQGGASVVRQFLLAHGVDRLPVYVDPERRLASPMGAGVAATPFIMRSMPITYVLAPNGQIVGYFQGMIDWRHPGADAFFAAVATLTG